MRFFVGAVVLAVIWAAGVAADGLPRDGDHTRDIKPVPAKKNFSNKNSSKKKVGKKKVGKQTKKKLKKRSRVQAPDFDVTQTAAWTYGQLTPAECEAEVKRRDLPFESEAADGVLAGGRLTGAIRGVTFRTRQSAAQRATSPWEILDCRLALALDDFAEVLVAHDVVEVRHYSMHRNVPRSWPAGKVGSQHYGGMAIDAAIFTTSDGTKIDVNDDWFGRIGAKTCGPDARPRRKTEKSVVLRAILCETAAKRIFNVILTPNHNRAHRNHFHLDITPGAKWFVLD